MSVSLAAFKDFRRVGTVVLVDDRKDEYRQISELVRPLRKKSGNTFPMVFVTTADGELPLDAASYEEMKEDMRASIKDLRARLEEKELVSGAAAKAAEETEPDSAITVFANAVEMSWTNKAGQAMQATPVQLDGDTITFRMPDGRSLEYAVADLSAQSQEQLASLQSAQ